MNNARLYSLKGLFAKIGTIAYKENSQKIWKFHNILVQFKSFCSDI